MAAVRKTEIPIEIHLAESEDRTQIAFTVRVYLPPPGWRMDDSDDRPLSSMEFMERTFCGEVVLVGKSTFGPWEIPSLALRYEQLRGRGKNRRPAPTHMRLGASPGMAVQWFFEKHVAPETKKWVHALGRFQYGSYFFYPPHSWTRD